MGKKDSKEMHWYLVWNMQKKPLCITACFKIFHTDENYKAILLAKRFLTWRLVSKKPMSLGHRPILDICSYKIPLVQYNATNNKFVAFIAFDAFCFMLNHDHDK